MAAIWGELKRRNVVRVAVAYAVVSWLILQLTNVLMPLLGLPEWVDRLVFLLLVVGFPLALIFAWAFELTPEGLKKEKDVDRSESITHITNRKLDFLIIGVLVVALGYFAYDKFVLDASRDAILIEATTQAVTERVVTEQEESTESDKSIAVLPFVNMSEETGNEYFADGLSEELLNMLVKIPELRVAARTSSFSFKGKDLRISEIAHELNVSHVLEGSVRKSGNKVRITAQLIKADDGFQLWSKTFDRTLDDIFVVQDEIASEVAKALKMTLMGKSQADRMIDPEAYALYLKGLHFTLQRGAEDYKKSEEALLQAIELDPGYAEAWATLAMNYYAQTNHKLRKREDGAALAKNAIGRAKSLDPDLGIVWGVDSYLKKSLDWDWGAAQAAINKAYELEPKNNAITIWRASMSTTIGKLDNAVELYEQGLLNDPLNLSAHSSLGLAYRRVHRYDEAIEIFEKQVELKPDYFWAYFNLGKSHLFKGDAEQALLEIKKNPENVFRNAGLVMAYSTLGREAEAEEALKRLVFEYGTQNPVWIAEVYSWRGQKDEAFEWLEKGFMQRSTGLPYLLGNVVFYSLTDDSRWTELLKKINLLEYWQAMPPEYGGPTKPPG
ncbi:MAG: tetratricopeptide repeat protein [Proteobacteria bacterium]|nr:tetratricopeptide repeat protein [Pseudomonadota bacterium]